MAELLAQQTRALRAQLEKYRDLLAQPLPDPSTIHIGDGYFVSMPVTEAQEFLQRKATNIENELAALNQLNGVNEEGLPVFDIVEELDEDGEIISSKVNKTGLASQLAAAGINRRDQKDLPSAEGHGLSPAEGKAGGVADPAGKTSDLNAARDQDSGLDSELSHIGHGGIANSDRVSEEQSAVSQLDFASLSPSDDDVQYIEDISELPEPSRIEEDQSNGEFPDINPADVLELELMDDEADNVTDFNFDDIEEDSGEDESDHEAAGHYNSDEDDDDDDEDDEWVGGSLFPQDEATLKLIQAHLALQNQPLDQPEETNGAKKSTKNAHVHFADSVDVREFETSSAERKLEPPTQMLSRFRMARQIQKPVAPLGRPNNGLSRPSKTTKPTSAAAAAAAAVVKAPHASAPTSPMNKAVVERSPPVQATQASNSSPSRDASPKRNVPAPLRKVSIPHTHPHAPQQHPQQPQQPAQHPVQRPSQQSAQPPAQQHRQQTLQQPKGTEKASVASNARNSTHQPSKPVDQLTKPSAVEKSGTPLADQDLKAKVRADAEKLFNGSFVPDDEFLRLHDSNGGETGVNGNSDTTVRASGAEVAKTKPAGKGSAAAEDKPVLSSVLERQNLGNADGDVYSDTGNNVNMTEIKQEYQRLRQKLIYESGGFKKPDSEKAVEPISADGEPKKVSRFKAARIR